jgi:hypothetical protein
MAAIEWNAATASEALAFAERFKDDSQLSVALLGRIITSTTTPKDDDSEEDLDPHDATTPTSVLPTVPGELHRQAFQVLNELVALHGDQAGIKVVSDENADALLGTMAGILQQQASEPWQNLFKMVSQARIPVGLAASMRGKSYALVLAQQATGPLIAASGLDDEHEAETLAAKAAFGGAVSIDASALMTLGQLNDSAELAGQFTAVYLAAASRRDIVRASSDVRDLSANPGSVSWDTRRGGIAFREITAAEYAGYARRVEGAYMEAGSTLPRVTSELTVIPNWQPTPGDDAWLSPLQVARDEGAPIWSDDLGLRRLARDLGLSAFGTPALADAVADLLMERGDDDSIRTSIEMRGEWVREFVKCQLVDVPAHLPEVLRQVEEDHGQPLAGALVISRASWWAWQTSPLNDLLRVYDSVSQLNPLALPDWQFAAMLGAGRAYTEPDAAAAMIAAIALMGFSEASDIDVLVDGCRRARLAAQEVDVPDPIPLVPLAARALKKGRYIQDAEKLAQDVIQAFGEAESHAGGESPAD